MLIECVITSFGGFVAPGQIGCTQLIETIKHLNNKSQSWVARKITRNLVQFGETAIEQGVIDRAGDGWWIQKLMRKDFLLRVEVKDGMKIP